MVTAKVRVVRTKAKALGSTCARPSESMPTTITVTTIMAERISITDPILPRGNISHKITLITTRITAIATGFRSALVTAGMPAEVTAVEMASSSTKLGRRPGNSRDDSERPVASPLPAEAQPPALLLAAMRRLGRREPMASTAIRHRGRRERTSPSKSAPRRE